MPSAGADRSGASVRSSHYFMEVRNRSASDRGGDSAMLLHRCSRRVAGLLCALVLAFAVPHPAAAQTNILSTPTLSSFKTVLRGGGTIILEFDGTISTTNTFIVSNNTVIETFSNNVTISGNNVARIFQVSSNVTFVVSNLIIEAGNSQG